jgi:hypothetical protein
VAADVLAPPRSAGSGCLSRARRGQLARSAAGALPAVAVIVFLAWPMLFTSAGLGVDWSSHLWLIWRQSLTIARDHDPSLFLNFAGSPYFSESVFYPFYAFYGGTSHALAGTLMLLVGSPVAGYVLTYIIGFAAAYGGWYWLGRMAGLGHWAAQAPGLLFITSGFYLTDVYARGDWSEFIAVSSIPLLVASGLSVLRAKRLRIIPALTLAGSTVVFFGTHAITMLWGISLIALLAVAIVVGVPRARRTITRAGVVRVLAVAVPAALVNAWYLLPTVAYESRTSVSREYDFAREFHAFSYWVSASNLFTPWHTFAARETPDFSYALPVLAIAWLLVGLALSLRFQGGGAWRRMLWIVSSFSVLTGILMTHPDLILDLPRPYIDLQFGFRLEVYVLLGLSAAVLTILVLARSWPRRWRLGMWAAASVALVGAGVGAAQQVDRYPGTGYAPAAVTADRYVVFTPHGQPPYEATGLECESGIGCGYDDDTLPLVMAERLPKIDFPIDDIRNDRVTFLANQPVGALVRTNLAGAPYFVNVAGGRAVGRDQSDHIVLEVTSAKGHPAGWISLSRANTLPIVLGRALTLLALVFLAVMFVGLLARHLRARLA